MYDNAHVALFSVFSFSASSELTLPVLITVITKVYTCAVIGYTCTIH